jgi:hypothetical protein
VRSSMAYWWWRAHALTPVYSIATSCRHFPSPRGRSDLNRRSLKPCHNAREDCRCHKVSYQQARRCVASAAQTVVPCHALPCIH